MIKRAGCVGIAILVLLAASALPAHARSKSDRSHTAAMWWSILHPGLGEWYLQDWGSFEKCPQKKFWLGFIPLYGWPGYLQVKSAVDAKHGRTNDKLTFD